jgi:hypothetical protein
MPVARAWHVGAAWITLRAASNRPCGASVFERVRVRVSRAREYQIGPNLARVDWSAARVAERRSRRGDRLRGELVFVQQPAEPVAPAEAIELRRL